MKSVNELKAQAFDMIVAIETRQTEIAQIRKNLEALGKQIILAENEAAKEQPKE